MDLWICGFLNFRFSVLGNSSIGFLYFWISVIVYFQISGFRDLGMSGFMDFPMSGLFDFWNSGFQDFGFVDVSICLFLD